MANREGMLGGEAQANSPSAAGITSSNPPASARNTSAATVYQTRLVRTRDRIHKPSCPNVKHADAVEWNWAESHDDEEWIKLGWLVPCQRCLWGLFVRQEEKRKYGDLVTDFAEWANAVQ